MFEGHDPYLVALSVVIAILGGYTGFGLAARIRGTPGVSRRLLLAGAAAFLAVGIWTMHFVGMLAAPIPADTVYLVLPTMISFLICALVVDGGIYRHEFVADTVIKALMDVQLRTEVPVFSAVLTPQQFHESAAHLDFFRRHFAIKGVEVAEACANTLLSLERLRGQVAAGIA